MAKSSAKKKLVRMLDVTPTWAEILPTLLIILRDRGEAGKKAAEEELRRMAKIADLYVAEHRGGR